jgi:C1A family cysteine protease
MGRASSNPKIRSSNLTFSSANFTGSFRKEYAIIMKKKLTAYLTRWSGPVLESVDPYEPFHNTSPPGLSAKKHI